MNGEVVVDASVAAKVFVTEDGSQAAESLVFSGVRLVAPELVLIELANVAAKRLQRREVPRLLAERMVASTRLLFDELVSMQRLVSRSFVLAADHGFSAYDASYLALAEQRGIDLVTADQRLIARAANAGLGVTVRMP